MSRMDMGGDVHPSWTWVEMSTLYDITKTQEQKKLCESECLAQSEAWNM